MANFVDGTLNSDEFINWLNELVQANTDPLAIFLDNASYQKSRLTRQAFERLNAVPIYNVSYRLNLNPKKEVFGQVKEKFKRKRLLNASNYIDYELRDLVIKYINKILQIYASKTV